MAALDRREHCGVAAEDEVAAAETKVMMAAAAGGRAEPQLLLVGVVARCRSRC
jgi:hypothetical protein